MRCRRRRPHRLPQIDEAKAKCRSSSPAWSDKHCRDYPGHRPMRAQESLACCVAKESRIPIFRVLRRFLRVERDVDRFVVVVPLGCQRRSGGQQQAKEPAAAFAVFHRPTEQHPDFDPSQLRDHEYPASSRAAAFSYPNSSDCSYASRGGSASSAAAVVARAVGSDHAAIQERGTRASTPSSG